MVKNVHTGQLVKTMSILSIASAIFWCKRLMLIAVSLVWLTIGSMQAGWADELPDADGTSSEMQQFVPNYSGIDVNTISTEKINQFIQAYLRVVGLIEQRESDLQSAETESESLQMQQAIRAEAVELIQEEDLTLQEYLQLLSLANVDPEFGERVAAQLQEAVR